MLERLLGLEHKLTAGEITIANKDAHDPYASYGADVPRSIPGSKQYWKSFGLDLVAMTKQLGIPNFFLTLSPNDNWPHIQSTIRKKWGASADPSEFHDLSIEPDNKLSVGPHPLESVLGAEKRFSAMLEMILNKNGGPLGIIKDYVIKTEYQKRGGIHWHILFWTEPGTSPANVVMAEMPRHSDTSNVEAQYARRMVQKYQMHRECFASRCFKGYGGKTLSKCKYGFPFKVPQLVKELDEDCVRFLYKRRCKEDSLVVPFNLKILLFWGASMNLQRVTKHGFEMYLAKYISKPESSFDVKLSENPSGPERYLRTRIIGACEAIDIQLGFNQYHMSRNSLFLITEINPTQKFLKTQVELNALPSDSEDVYLQTKFETYLERNKALYEITYPMYFQWWRKSTYSEQCKAEKEESKGNSAPSVGYKGIDEFIELKESIQDGSTVVTLFKERLENLTDVIKHESNLQRTALSIIKSQYQHVGIVKCFTKYLLALGYDETIHSDNNNNGKSFVILNNAGLLESSLIDKANKPHWLHAKLLEWYGDDVNITGSPLYKMLETYPAGTMLKDGAGSFWIRRARASVTRHRFITVDDQENYYMQKYLLTTPVTPNDDISTHPPLSWIQVAMNANLVDQHHDVRVNLLDAV